MSLKTLARLAHADAFNPMTSGANQDKTNVHSIELKFLGFDGNVYHKDILHNQLGLPSILQAFGVESFPDILDCKNRVVQLVIEDDTFVRFINEVSQVPPHKIVWKTDKREIVEVASKDAPKPSPCPFCALPEEKRGLLAKLAELVFGGAK